MPKHKFTRVFTIIVELSLIFLFAGTGCHENTLINAKVSPANNAVALYSYTLPVITHSYLDDSTVTSTNLGGIPIYQAVGSLYDPFFGTMTGATYFEIVPTDLTPDIYTAGDSIDSAVLILPYSGFTYGDTTTTGAGLTQTYQVFYMVDTMGLYTNYYSYSTKNIDFTYPLSDPITINISSLKDSFGINVLPVNYPSLRVKLKLPVLLSHLMPALNLLDTATNPYQDFLNAFGGICVAPINSDQYTHAIPYFELGGGTIYSEADVLVYYHPFGYPGDTLVEPYYFNPGNCAHFNNVTKSFNHFPVSNVLHYIPNDTALVMQNQPGESIDVLIPGIMKRLDTAIGKGTNAGIIVKAELQFTLLPGYYTPNNAYDTLFAPENLTPLGIGNGTYPTGVGYGLAYEIADRYPLTSLTPLTVMDGNLHAITHGSTTVQTFTVDLPRETIASIQAGNDTIHLHISGTSDFYGAFHMVAGGGGYPNRRANYPDSLYVAKFVVTYSKLKNP